MLRHRPEIECFARIAACAAILTTSLFGQWLHYHAYHSENGQVASSSCPSQSPCHACGHSHSKPAKANDEKPTEDQKSPAVPHDHNSCAICYVIGQAVSNRVIVVLPTSVEPLFEKYVVLSEFAIHALRCTATARGPPAA